MEGRRTLKLLIKDGRVLDPSRAVDGRADVLLEDGRIAGVGPALDRDGLGEDVVVLDAADCLVTPGLIDMHVHLREPGQEYSETIATGTRAAAMGGFTAVACMPNTEPALDDESRVRFVVETARRKGAVRVHPIAAITRGRGGKELTDCAELVEAGAVAFSDDGSPVVSARMMRRALEYTRMLGVPIVSHSEDPDLSAGGVMHEGRISTRLGMPGIPDVSESAAMARDMELADLTGGRLHLCHVSTAASVDLIRRARARGVAVTAEVTPHHIALTDEAVAGFDPNFKMNPPLRSERDRDAVRAALADGTIAVAATDHAPHADDLKNVEFGLAPFGVVGLETALGVLMTQLAHPGIVALDRLIDALTAAPARVLGLPTGTLAPGAPADVTVIDPAARWKVEPAAFASLSHNTPFAGWELQGKAVATIVEGRIVMHRGELFPDPRHLASRSSARL